jgi:hypothetical protein
MFTKLAGKSKWLLALSVFAITGHQYTFGQSSSSFRGWYFQGNAQETGGASGKGMLWIKSRDAQNNITAHYLAYGGLITDALLSGRISPEGGTQLTGKTDDGNAIVMSLTTEGAHIAVSYRITQPDVPWKATRDYTATLDRVDPETLPLTLDPGREFAVGDLVEVDKLSDGRTWVRGKVTGLSGPVHWAEGRCQQYYVQALESNQAIGGAVDCRRIRSVSSASNPKPKPAAGGQLIMGEYSCSQTVWDYSEKRIKYDPKGNLTINSNGTYRLYANGDLGRYAYNTATGTLSFTGGYFNNGNPVTAVFTNSGRTSAIYITIKTGSGNLNWGCGHTN